ncbi:MAG: hypothetical protein HPY53_13525 [Brevinematales bacterium]|nr:hypothetical protein [Brevinematales bacterium]
MKYLIFLALFMISCNSGSSVEKKPATLYAWVDNVNIRTNPDPALSAIGQLSEGQEVLWMGETSSNTATYTLRGETITAPFIKIQYGTNQTGWVFQGALKDAQTLEIHTNADPYEAFYAMSIPTIMYLFANGKITGKMDKLTEDEVRMVVGLAVEQGKKELVMKILKLQGLDYNGEGLEAAAAMGNLDTLKKFIPLYFNLTNSVYADGIYLFHGQNLLFYAVPSGNVDVVKYLVSQGYSVKDSGFMDGIGYPLDSVPITGDLSLLKYMVEKLHAPTAGELISKAAAKNDDKLVKYLIENGAYTDNALEILIIDACRKGNLPMVKYYISKGVDFMNMHYYEYNDSKAGICIDVANKNGHDDIVAYLKSIGAKLSK